MMPMRDLVERLQETVERLQAQTSAMEAIITAARERLGEYTMATR
jgi:hypothetical protein